MDAAAQARDAIVRGINALLARGDDPSTDAAEKAAIQQAISDLDRQERAIDFADLQAAAAAVANATAALERVIAVANVGPLGEFRSSINDAIGQLNAAQSQLPATVSAPRAEPVSPTAVSPAASSGTPAAPVPPAAPPGPPAPPVAPAAPAAAPLAQLPPINPSTTFADLGAEYQAYFDACVPDPAHSGDVRFVISQLQKNRPTYEAVGVDLQIPWYFIGLLHCMECSFDFHLHLHNGDPLTARTVNVPAGQPRTGSPPFSWQASARDALTTVKHFDHLTDWSVPQILYRLETNNGFGYRSRRLASPYLWSFSNLYRAGKFVADNKFDPNAVSQQCGAGVTLRVLHTTGVV